MNISLIGMMGSGKSTIGKLLSETLTNYSFADTDTLIIKKENCTINEIFLKNGEGYFRKIESEILSNLLQSNNLIISTGGGIIKSKENIELLKQKTKIFYLYASVECLTERLKNSKERPLLNCDDIKQKITTLLNEREMLYKNTAHYSVNTNYKTPEKIVSEIIGLLEDN